MSRIWMVIRIEHNNSKRDLLIPVRMLTQYVYCKRLAYMEWVQGEFAYNTEVVDGKYEQPDWNTLKIIHELLRVVITISKRLDSKFF